MPADWDRPHAEARDRGDDHYRDPRTGYRVFTEAGLRARGRCCGCGCRHCPWAHQATPLDRRAETIVQPAFLHVEPPSSAPLAVVFWSGGKDSYLALRAVCRQTPHLRPVLVTSFDLRTRIVAHQELPIARLATQARALRLPLLGVPLPRRADYRQRIQLALTTLAREAPIDRLVFGDLHLQHIRDWRCDQLGPLAAPWGAELCFPLWNAAYPALHRELVRSGARARICAAPQPGLLGSVRIGDLFDPATAARLPPGTDRFGESGEFHTEVLAESLRPLHTPPA